MIFKLRARVILKLEISNRKYGGEVITDELVPLQNMNFEPINSGIKKLPYQESH